MAFFTFRQNNSGGWFDEREGKFGLAVVIEAADASEANDKAEHLGLYFDGVDAGRDCECCGDRWYPVYGSGDTEPSYYDKLLKQAAIETGYSASWQNLPIYVHFLDGRIEKYTHGKAEPEIVASA